MYNEATKSRYIKECIGGLSTAKLATTIFNEFEPYENLWGADLCTKSAEDLQIAVDNLAGRRAKSKWPMLCILREYVKWCMAMGVPGACGGMLQINTVGLEKVKRQMVSSPLHLQKFLDSVFRPEPEEMIDNLYRCYFWMAYGGIDEEDVVQITVDQVNLQEMFIAYKDTSVPIYREAIPAFRNAVKLSSFAYTHPGYNGKTIRRDRMPGNTLMRGIKTMQTPLGLRHAVSMANKKAADAGNTHLQLGFYRVRMSGYFYRVYEAERAGDPAQLSSFTEAAIRLMDGKTYAIKGRATIEHKQNRIQREYMEDYQRWKLAFSI